MVKTWYEIGNTYGITLAVLADIHARRVEECIAFLEQNKPDIILIPGDLVDGAAIKKCTNHRGFIDDAISHLNWFTQIVPTYYSIGNHEKQLSESEICKLGNSDAAVLDNSYVKVMADLYIGGFSSGRNYYEKKSSQEPNISFIEEYENLNGFKILLSHHPEYYEPYLKGREVNLIISGHAHGGQIRIGNHGLYAPGQGIFPKYTSGIHDGKFVVSRGVAGTEILPRINNKPEIVYIKI